MSGPDNATDTTTKPILLEKKGSYAIITLNRPEKRNALSIELLHQLKVAMEEVKGECSVVILTGTGDKAFCAGMDLTEARATEPVREYAHGGHQFFEVLETMRRHPAVFIAAVNGYALGGGLTLTHNSELAIAAEHATFGMPEIGFGVFPALAGPTTIHRVQPKKAAWMVLTGARADAIMAERWGVVNEVVPADKLMTRTEELAAYISKFDPIALDYSKKALREVPTLEWSRGIDYGFSINAVIARQSSVAADGIAKFVAGGRNTGQGAAEKPSNAK